MIHVKYSLVGTDTVTLDVTFYSKFTSSYLLSKQQVLPIIWVQGNAHICNMQISKEAYSNPIQKEKKAPTVPLHLQPSETETKTNYSIAYTNTK